MRMLILANVSVAGVLGCALVGNAAECYTSSIIKPSPFMGNNGEIFQLANGTLWEVKYEYEYLYEYYPDVIICPSRHKLIVDEKELDVAPLD